MLDQETAMLTNIISVVYHRYIIIGFYVVENALI